MILMYHKIYPENLTAWWVDVDNFYRQMCELRCKRVVYLDNYDPKDPDNVVITFDGIYKNVLDYAAPILKKFAYPFELFITGEYIGKDNSFDAAEPKADFASAEELKHLIEKGGRLQWHTKSHQKLDGAIDRDIIIDEIEIPIELRGLDHDGFKWFAYPHGIHNERVIEEVKKRFKGALSCVQGNNIDIYMLNRVTVTNETSFKPATISVLIPSYNYGPFLIEALESVLRQTRPADEIIIADDCSDDNTGEIAMEYQKKHPQLIKYYRNEKNLGIVKNFNKAVRLSTGNYVSFLGADNRFRSDYIEKTAELLDRDEKVAIAYSDFALFGQRAKLEYSRFPEECKGGSKENYYYIIKFPDFNEETAKRLEKGNFMHGSSLYRRIAFDEVGGYKEREDLPEDHNLFLSMIKNGWKAKRVPNPILEYRQHSREQTNIKLQSYLESKFYKEHFEEKLNQIAALEEVVRQLDEAVREKEATLAQIYSSRGWKALLIYYKLRNKIFPPNTKRRTLVMAIFNALKRGTVD